MLKRRPLEVFVTFNANASRMAISSAMQRGGLILVTDNVPEFAHVPALEVENWVSNE